LACGAKKDSINNLKERTSFNTKVSNAEKITLNVDSMETVYKKRYGAETKIPPMEVARIKTALQRRKTLTAVETDTPNCTGARRNPQEATVSQCVKFVRSRFSTSALSLRNGALLYSHYPIGKLQRSYVKLTLTIRQQFNFVNIGKLCSKTR
jgi:hypothetical protein